MSTTTTTTTMGSLAAVAATWSTSSSSSSTNKYHKMRYYVEPCIIFSGIILNLVLMVIIYAKRRTKAMRSTKPLRYLLIAMLVSDTWFLIYQGNIWYHYVRNKPDLSSFNVVCQVNTYLNYFFSIMLEFNMLSADWILLRIVFKLAEAMRRQRRRHNALSVYDQFYLPSSPHHESRSKSEADAFKKRQKQQQQLRPHSISLSANNENTKTPKVTPVIITTTTADIGRERSTIMLNEIQDGEITDNENSTTNNKHLTEEVSHVDGSNTQINKGGDRNDENESQRINFFILVSESNFKNENSYLEIVFKEKITIILTIFILMYLLSFLLWIRGVKTISLGEPTLNIVDSSHPTSTSILESAASIYASMSISGYMKHSTAQEKQWSTSPTDANNNTASSNISPDYYSTTSNFELSVTSFCVTHDFALLMFKIFALFIALLRLFTLLANLFTSICFHFKFRYEYYNAFRVSYNGENSLSEEDKGSHIVRYKSFQTWVSIRETSKISHKYSHISNERSSSTNKSQPTTPRLTKQSTTSTATSMGIGPKHIDSHYSHFHFIRHYALVTFFYACICSPCVLNDNIERFKDLRTSLSGVFAVDDDLSVITSSLQSSNSIMGLFNNNNNNNKKNNNNIAANFLSMVSSNHQTLDENYPILDMSNFNFSPTSNTKITEDTKNNGLNQTSPFLAYVKNLTDFNINNNEDNIKILLNLIECFSHSFKFFIYIFFSTHLNCYFRVVSDNKLRGSII